MMAIFIPPGSRDELEYLIERTRQGDHGALAALLGRVRRYLERMAKPIRLDPCSHCGVDAEDLVQEALIAVYHAVDPGALVREGHPVFRGNSASQFVCWLSRILWCKTADAMRRRNGRNVLTGYDLLSVVGGQADVMFHDHLERREAISRLRAAIDGLPKDARRIVWLRWFRGLSFRDIADDVGRAEPTVRSIHHRALRRLRCDKALRHTVF